MIRICGLRGQSTVLGPAERECEAHRGLGARVVAYERASSCTITNLKLHSET